MARCTVVEYGRLFTGAGVPYAFPDESTRTATQTAKTSFATSQAYSTFNANSGWILVSTDTALHYRVGVSPTATQNDPILPANQSILIPIPPKPTGQTIAILAFS